MNQVVHITPMQVALVRVRSDDTAIVAAWKGEGTPVVGSQATIDIIIFM